MSDKPKQRLIIISGSPCVGKTTVATALFESYENSAYCDGDWVWCVNPFSIDDPRLRCGDKNMSFVISTYLNAHFDTVILSTVVAMYPSCLLYTSAFPFVCLAGSIRPKLSGIPYPRLWPQAQFRAAGARFSKRPPAGLSAGRRTRISTERRAP